MIGLFGDELRYVSIKMAAFGIPFAPYVDTNPEFEKWDDHVKDFNKNASKGINKSKQMADMHWVFMMTERAFVESAI